MAQDFVKEINLQLEPHVQCVQLKLKNVIAANLVGEAEEQKFRFTIETSPSDAIFEALLLFDPFSYQSTVVGDINRINKYGSQSLCVNDQFLRKLCFCSTFLEVVPKK